MRPDNFHLHLNDGARVVIGVEADIRALVAELSVLLGEDADQGHFGELYAYLLRAGTGTAKTLDREQARRIRDQAERLLPMTYGYVQERSKYVLERIAGLAGI